MNFGIALMLGASSGLLAQSILPPASPSHSTAPDVRQIVEASTAATQLHWRARLGYTYTEREESRRRDLTGHFKSEDVDVSRMILVNGVPYGRLVEHNGRPPSADEETKQQDQIDKLKREMPEKRAERLRKEEEESVSLIREVPKAFDFRLVGEEIVNGRPAYVLEATPHRGYQAQGKYGKMFPRVEGKLWVDKQDLGWIKVDAQVIQPFSMAFLARVQRGSRIMMDQTRVDGGVWMPARVEVRASAKIFFIKNLVIDQVVTYSDYRQAAAGITAEGNQ